MNAGSASLAKWLPYRVAKNSPDVRLFCFAHAGGGASVFRDWPDRLPMSVEVCAVQLPGREARLMERPFTRMEELVDALAPAIAPLLDRPFAVFGYSLGAAIAWEMACRIQHMAGLSPSHVFACARRAPHFAPRQEQIHALPEAAFKQKLRALGGTPEEALNNAELLELILPILRADFELNDTYISQPPMRQLRCAMTVLGGEQDTEVSPKALESWQEFTSGQFSSVIFPGAHFFLKPHLNEILTLVGQTLTAEITAGAH